MKYIDEYRDADLVKKYIDEIHAVTKHEWTIMEICGGQTHVIMKYGIDQLLPKEINFLHGPGCPVCVTPLEMIDKAIVIASRDDVIFCSFGDMLRVPGSNKDLFTVKSEGGQIRIIYSPLDAIKIAQENPDKKVVFFAIGFETTAPANAMAVKRAKDLGLKNFSVLVSHVLVPPAISVILDSPDNHVQGFVAAGHVCSVMGYNDYIPIAKKYNIPIVVSGFEPVDLLQGVLMLVKQLEAGENRVENQYSRSVLPDGNIAAKKIMNEVFKVSDRKWRGIGTIPMSGFTLNDEFDYHDAEKVFADIADIKTEEPAECISGLILQGIKKPVDCEAFGKKCTPEHPLGATMVSSEGTCAAYYNYGRLDTLKNK
ncbi:hydrogenase formation protein HypD [Bacteroidota bacterium]